MFGEKLFQTKLLSRLSHKVCRFVPSPVLLRKINGESDTFTAPWSNSRAVQTTFLFLHLVFVVNN